MRDTAGMMVHRQTTAQNFAFSPKKPPVNETDMVLLPEGLHALQQVAKEVGLAGCRARRRPGSKPARLRKADRLHCRGGLHPQTSPQPAAKSTSSAPGSYHPADAPVKSSRLRSHRSTQHAPSSRADDESLLP